MLVIEPEIRQGRTLPKEPGRASEHVTLSQELSGGRSQLCGGETGSKYKGPEAYIGWKKEQQAWS